MNKPSLLVVGIIIVLLFCGIFLPSILTKSTIETFGSDLLKTSVTVEDADLSLTSGSLVLRNIKVANSGNFNSPNALTIEEILLDLKPLSLLSDEIQIQEIHISAPIITVETSMSGTNYGRLRDAFYREDKKKPSDKKEKRSDKHVTIDHLLIDKAQLYFTAGYSDQKPGDATVTLPVIELTDLGKGTSKETFKNILNTVIVEATSSLNMIDKSFVKGVKKDIDSSVKTITNKFKNLF